MHLQQHNIISIWRVKGCTMQRQQLDVINAFLACDILNIRWFISKVTPLLVGAWMYLYSALKVSHE